MKKFSKSHEWIEVEGRFGTVGISKYAQEELGEVVYVELPEIGSKIESGKEVAVIESTKAAADVYAPISGEVIEINSRLEGEPNLVNSDAEGEGWLFKVSVEKEVVTEHLMKPEEYAATIG